MRWILRIFSGLLVLIVGAVLVLFLLPAEKIADLVSEQFEAATGRAMTLQGDVRPTLWPDFGVDTGAVSIANADWSGAGPMLRAERLSISVDISALLGGTIKINRVEVDAPSILLEVAEDGRANWDLGRSASAIDDRSERNVELPGLSLDRATIRGGRLTYVDHRNNSRTDIKNVEATISLPDLRGSAVVQMAASMNGQSVAVKASTESLAGFLSEGAVPVDANVKIGGSTFDFAGRAGLQPVAAGGRFDANLEDLAAVFSLIALEAPEIPRGLGQTTTINGMVTLTEQGALTLRDATFRLDQNILSGAVDLDWAERPRITARLAGGALDFSAAMGSNSPATADAPAGSGGWSRSRIDASGMQSIDADIALTAGSIDLGFAKLGRTSTITSLVNGRAVTEIRELAAYDGSMSGSFVVNSRGGLSVRADLAGDGVALQPLLQQLAGYDRLLAAGTVTINVLGVGNDMYTLMNSLNGTGTLTLGTGELRGLDLVGMLRNFDASFVGAGVKTIFNSITGSFVVTDGVMSNVDLKLTAPLLSATGSGKIGIGGQTLDYRVVPKLLENAEGGGISVPLVITGTWAKPKFRIDLEALAKQELADDAQLLKSRAEEAVKAKLENELGVKVEDLDNVEEVLKKEAEDRIRKGLLDLLQGN